VTLSGRQWLDDYRPIYAYILSRS